ncbi:MAG: hypothetical protein KDI15_03175, partial [Thiothrix sp.]|nr:hypothetical protein [Thiothrix sp.]
FKSFLRHHCQLPEKPAPRWFFCILMLAIICPFGLPPYAADRFVICIANRDSVFFKKIPGGIFICQVFSGKSEYLHLPLPDA